MDEPSIEDSIVYPISEALKEDHLDNSRISEYIVDYLNYFNVKSFIKERSYVDKDYIIDYSKFYARSFEPNERVTDRLHFFSDNITNEEFSKVLETGDEEILSKIKKTYLGFVVVKPIKNKHNKKLIGRTVLMPYDYDVTDDSNQKRMLLKQKNIAHLYGIRLEIPTLPFQTQDVAVGACATTACWIAINALARSFDVQKLSPIEITEKSVAFPSEGRNFPSTGLTYFQIKNYFNSVGLDTEFIDPSKIIGYKAYDSSSEDIIADIAKAYIRELNLPIIAGLELKRNKSSIINIPLIGNLKAKERKLSSQYHAVVISGYRHEKGRVIKLYIHDDQIGPYSRVTPRDKDFFSWENKWLDQEHISEVVVDKLIIPVYPKIRLTFKTIYPLYLRWYKRKLDVKIKKEGINPNAKYELFLTNVKKYKKNLFEQQIDNKKVKLQKPLPRFLWIIRLECDDIIYYDYIYDATSVLAKKAYDSIIYRH